MPTVDVNWWALVAATIINMIVGSIWYSPLLFAKPWAKFTGKKMNEMGDGSTSYVITAAGAFIQAFILLHFVSYVAYFYPTYGTVSVGLLTGLWAWLGFVAIPQMTNTVFEGRRKKLWAINAGYFLVVLVVNGILLASWR